MKKSSRKIQCDNQKKKQHQKKITLVVPPMVWGWCMGLISFWQGLFPAGWPGI
jgi:hypothetical protein